ncbi:MAG: sigma 54-interacting transcriptional regulator [bacterium]|nr:sigma 54-interacting transcriptional regulator [bacterium]MDT8367118.1 sigma 54-interacting transcriptional regulator [bacterium]
MKQNLPLSFIELLFDKLDPDRFMALFLEALTSAQKVERGSIWIRKGDGYVCVEASGDEADKVKGFILSRSQKSIVGAVIESGRMTIAEPDKDRRHFKEVDRRLDTKNSLILCFPLHARDDTVYGAVQILDTTAGGFRMNLDPEYLELLQGLVAIGSIALSTVLELAEQFEQNVDIKKVKDRMLAEPLMIGQSQEFLKVLDLAKVYSSNQFPVMITGESGTGKELLAREIHRLSPRKNRPFLTQNCSAIPENLLESELFGYKKGAFTGADKDKLGLFEASDGGTVFLDEIGDMALGLQAKILRVLQSSEVKPLGSTTARKVDVRIISATNKNLVESIKKGGFRKDLYYRLNVLPLEVPPVRKRRDDIPLLLTHFMAHYTNGPNMPIRTFSPEAMEVLVKQLWPGNIREIENLAKYLLTVTEGNVEVTDLPPPYNAEPKKGQGIPPAQPHDETDILPSTPPPAPGAGASMDEMERKYMLSVLEMTKWNVAAAARHAGIKRTTFNSRMKKHGISKKG